MKITLVMVSTINGRITKGADPNVAHWASKEDQKHFAAMIGKYNLLVMGSKTYEAAGGSSHAKPGTLRIVLTQKPKKYQTKHIPGKLEFMNVKPKTLVAVLGKRGYKNMLLLGGGQTNALFLKAGLVDELYLTVEPKIFGLGAPLFGEENYFVAMNLLSMKKINKQGTLLLRYKIKH